MFKRCVKRLAPVVLLFVMPVWASAYTIVLRDGRRIEVPDNFIVGNSTLTYQAGTGIQITLQLVSINISATELANNERAGALLNRAASLPQPAVTTAAKPTVTSAKSVITNADLERFRSVRLASERAYEQRQKELGLPSLEESRQAILQVGERADAQLLRMREQQEQAEKIRRSEVELRLQLEQTNARIESLQYRYNDWPLNYGFWGGPSFGRFRIDPTNQSFGIVDQLSRGAVLRSPGRWHGRTFAPTFSPRVRLFNGPRVRGR
jgi:hypothetical protein